mgnify:CR=1 FL=1
MFLRRGVLSFEPVKSRLHRQWMWGSHCWKGETTRKKWDSNRFTRVVSTLHHCVAERATNTHSRGTRNRVKREDPGQFSRIHHEESNTGSCTTGRENRNLDCCNSISFWAEREATCAKRVCVRDMEAFSNLLRSSLLIGTTSISSCVGRRVTHSAGRIQREI